MNRYINDYGRYNILLHRCWACNKSFVTGAAYRCLSELLRTDYFPIPGSPSASPPTEKYPLPLDSCSLPAKVTKRCAQLRPATAPAKLENPRQLHRLDLPVDIISASKQHKKSLVSALSVISQFHRHASLFCRSPAQAGDCHSCSPASQLHSWSSPPSSVKLFCTSRAPSSLPPIAANRDQKLTCE